MANIASILEGALTAGQRERLRVVARVGAEFNLRCWLVGGGVRDALLGLPLLDLDVAAVGATREFADGVAEALGGAVESASQFNTFRLGAGGERIDIAMARRETYARPGALPSVSPGMMAEDLARRDFSINAMAASISEDAFGELLDPFEGERDLRRGVVRALRPMSFVDDATRILRAARYAKRLGFAIEARTDMMMARDATHLGSISGARVRGELERVFGEERPAEILEALRDCGGLRAIHPALDLPDDALAAVGRAAALDCGDRALALLGALAYWVPDGDRAGLVGRLSMSAAWARVVDDVGLVKAELDALAGADVRRSEIYDRLTGRHCAAIAACAVCVGDGEVAGRLELYGRELAGARAALTGDDLLGLGMAQGPAVGRLLGELLRLRLDGELGTREEELEYARERIGGISGGFGCD